MSTAALRDALTALAYALDPWFGHTGLTAPADPADPFGPTVRLCGPLFHETPARGDARRAAAVDRFKAGLASAPGSDAARIREQIADAERLAETVDFRAYGQPAGPRYAAVVADALARLAADAEPVAAGTDARWCPECRTRRAVAEVDGSCSTYDGAHEVGWIATHLACGHTLTTTPVVIGRSPGGESAAEAQAQAATSARLTRTHALADAYGDL